jgi:hypothetical protein
MVKNKKAVSVMVGYVLLITIGLIMGVIAYNYLKTYVPKDLPTCPKGVSIFVEDYTCEGGQLNITIQNKGKFNIVGYNIYASDDINKKIATINLATNFTGSLDTNARLIEDSYIIFMQTEGEENTLIPMQDKLHYFNISSDIEFLQITPLRFQEEGNHIRLVSCEDASIREEIVCT